MNCENIKKGDCVEVYFESIFETIKDPCFAECSHSQTRYLKCPYCSSTIEDEVSWDN